jgi:uncharacterized protein YbjT (DUF2867 family)
MTPLLVTGATGTLGVPTVSQLRAAGADVRSLSRRSGPGLVTGDLVTATGLEAALDGVGTVLHLATGRKDVLAARNLAAAARAGGVRHLMFISIVGVDSIPFPYYRAKLAVEREIESSGVPYTVLRATQFHAFVVSLLAAQRRLPALLAPAFSVQPIAVEEVAARLVELATDAPAGRVPDIGGPAVRPLPELARVWAGAAGVRRPVLPLRLPGRTFRAWTAGHGVVPGPAYGRIPFEEYLASRYGQTP